MKNNKNYSGFTLIEILIGILIFTVILIGAFQILSSLGIARAKLMIETNIQKKAFYFSEKLFEEIKSGGVIDYEEYFNRKVFNLGKTDLYSSGHYKDNAGFGNFGSYYFCRSYSDSIKMLKLVLTDYINKGCFDSSDLSTGGNQEGKKQRYGEYILQFVDYNTDPYGDNGDPNGDGSLIGDNDDEFLGRGPEAFSGALTELYLISGDKKKRTFFRYSVKQDPNINPTLHNCTTTDGKTYNGSGCLGTIEFLKLDGKDWGENHLKNGTGAFDGYIDTWIINNRFSGNNNTIAGSGTIEYWQPLFDDSINVEDFKIFLYPNKNTNLTWKENNTENTAPYLKLQMTLKPSWKTRKQIKGGIPKIPINMTISLSDVLSN